MAHKLRTQRKYSEAISILEDTIKQPLSLYALTSASFELSRNYQELGQQEQALYHIRHAAVDAGMMIDKGLRRSALAREIELEALSQHYWRAVCDLESFTKYYRPDELEPHLRALGEKARTELLGSTSISSDVILIDPKRRDVEPYWTRRLIRPVVRIRAAEGHISSARVICRTEAIDLPVGPAIEFQVNGRKGGCDIYVFANPGTRLQVTESP
jgi:hypothetical protein